ncbi:MAG: hypothetical protein A2X49_12015 [Lentisphaerae bacterium GWF2_52_8]|nr:MAG: hypothetical protein A2X49_12015 [Lentisphaerae bacterium GWF2_52_8]
MNTIAIKPELLKWARERAGLLPSDISKDKRFTKYELWESGKKMPTFKQLEGFAHKTYTPFGYFFLPKPPPEDKIPIPDFRTIKNKCIQRPSLHLLDTIQTMQSRQEWMRDFFISEREEKLPFIGSAKGCNDPIKIAADIRGALNKTPGWAERHWSYEEALRTLRNAIDDLGIMIVSNGVVGNSTNRALDPEEFRGFVLVDEYAPLIFINGNDTKSARMFTIAHELAHLWLGESGVFNFEKTMPAENKVERLCNMIAAEFLVPKAELNALWGQIKSDEDRFNKIAKKFKVSSLVAARRAFDLSFISESQFYSYYEHDVAQYIDLKKKRKPGGNAILSQNTRVGKLFGLTVGRAVREGKLLYRDAYQLTGLNGNIFEKFISGLEMNLV